MRQSLDLRVKNAQEGKVGMIPPRGTLHGLNGRIRKNECAHRFHLM